MAKLLNNGILSLCLGVSLAWGAQSSGLSLEAVTRALSRRQYDEALRLVEPIVRADLRNPRAWTAKGMTLTGLGRRREALACFDKALGLRPDFLPALEGAAQITYNSQSPRAQSVLDRILSLQPDNPTAHAMSGVLAFERKDCLGAVAHFEKSESVIAARPLALWQFGQCLISSDRPDKAAEVFGRLLALEPTNAQARYNLGLAQFKAGRSPEALATLRILAENPKPDADVLNLIAAAYEADHQTDAAVAALRKATEIAPQDVRNYLDLAALCMDHSAFALGIEIVDIGLRNLPDSATLYTMRGILHAQASQFEEAEADFSRANLLDPNQIFGSVGLGITFLQRDNPAEAIHQLRERLRGSPGDAALNYLLAEALLRKGAAPGQAEFEEARSALIRSVAAKPDFAKAHAQLAKLYLLSGDTQSALREGELAVKLAPDDRMAVYSLVRALKEAGRSEEAKPLLLKLREIDARELKEEGDRNRVKLVRAPPARPIEP